MGRLDEVLPLRAGLVTRNLDDVVGHIPPIEDRRS
jgi:hypothetical protein